MEIERVVKIYKKNKFLFFKKTFLKLIRIFYSSFFLPLSIILFLFILIIKLFITIRISSIPTSRIGHLSGNVDLYLCHKKYIQKENTLDIFFEKDLFLTIFYIKNGKKNFMWGIE